MKMYGKRDWKENKKSLRPRVWKQRFPGGLFHTQDSQPQIKLLASQPGPSFRLAEVLPALAQTTPLQLPALQRLQSPGQPELGSPALSLKSWFQSRSSLCPTSLGQRCRSRGVTTVTNFREELGMGRQE